MRKAYYLEVLENKDIRKKLLEKIIHVNYSTFKLPPGFESKKILPFIPKMPFTPFKIPPGFNFEDRRNYPKDMKDIKRILDGEYF